MDKLKTMFSGVRDERILMLGLDAAGKTTVLYKLQLGEVTNTMPTIGFNVETLKYKKLNMQVWDVGGQEKIRSLWRHYYQNTDALIYVVDSSDHDRMDEAREELQRILADDAMRDVAILVYANKQDLPKALGVKEVARALRLDSERRRHWHVQSAQATKGDGLVEGLDWLNTTLSAMPQRR